MLKKSIFSTLLANIAILALGMANSILLARFLGPAGRGQVAAAMLWPTMLIYLGSLGILPAGVYFAAEPRAKLGRVLGTSSLICLVLAILSAIAGYLAMPMLLSSQNSDVIRASRIYLLVLPISLAGLCGINILLGVMRAGAMNLLRMIVPIGYLAGTIVLGVTHTLSVGSIVLLHIGLNAAFLLATAVVLFIIGPMRELGLDRDLVGRMWRYGLKVHVGTVGGLANQNMSQALLASLSEPSQLGFFVTASSAAAIAQTLSNAVQTIIVPRLRQESQALGQTQLLARILRAYCTLAIGGAIIYGLMFPWLLVLMFGEAFRAAILPGELLILAFVLNGVRDILIGGAQALGRPLVGSGVQWLGAGVTALALLMLMPRWGIVGAAAANLIASMVQVGAIALSLRQCAALEVGECFRLEPIQLFKWIRFAPHK